MALSLRRKQLDVMERMLHLNLQQHPRLPDGGDGQGEEEAYKILVMDSHCVSILSPVLRVNDLRRHGVTLHLGIDRPRQAVPDAPALYLARPTPANADRIAADAAAGLYASFHLNFSTSLPRPLLDRLAAACAASPASAQRVARVADQYLDFVCLEEGLFSLAQPRAYVALNDPAAADADITALVDAVALGLFCVAATLGVVPVIRCARGGPAEMVAAALDARLRDHLLAKPNLFTEAASATISSFQRPVLCLFDRNFELSVGVQHDWSYRPLVHDVLGLKLNKLKLPAEKYELDDSDKFWVANSWSPFPKVAEEIEAQLAKYKQDVDEVNHRTGGGKAGVEFDGTDLIGNTKHLMNAVNSLPELTERKKMIDKHTNIATALLGHIKERSLDGYCDCENDMLANSTVDRNTLLSLLRGKGTKEDKLRLAVTYLLSFGTPPSSELEQVEAALRESEVDMSAFQYVKRIKALNSQFAAASGTATKSNIVDWAEKLYGQSLSAVTAGVKNLLSDGRQLALTRTVEALMEGKPNPEVDDYLLFDPRAPRSGTGGQFKGPFREAIVFMIGGGNYIEYKSLMELEHHSQLSKHVIYGVTEILSGAEFIHQLAELGQKAGLGGGGSNNSPPPGPAQ